MSGKHAFRRNLPLHLMIFPGLLLLIIFSYIPMAGLYIAFQKFIPAKGFFGDQRWIGWDNFVYMLDMPGIYSVLWNTVFIAGMKMIAGLIVPITVALLLNELRSSGLRRGIQTLVYLPHFLSWIILAGVLIDILSPSSGLVNQLLNMFGLKSIFFLGSNDWFPYTMVISDVWKEFGFATIVYLAALTGIDPQQYEAAVIDGANRWKQTWHVTLPGMRMIIVLMMVLSMGNILNAGFDQIVNLYSAQVYQSGDIIDTLVYRIGLQQAQYGVATAVGLFKSVVSFLFISVAYFLAYKLADYRIF
ncbi:MULTISPECIES: ABC transporter permease [unclassified Paenibacillus]|uniref:ABC transporter permease n=1 Tax=unclassified Paenibacillus TaxID=185978 RepID=UPI002F4082AC